MFSQFYFSIFCAIVVAFILKNHRKTNNNIGNLKFNDTLSFSFSNCCTNTYIQTYIHTVTYRYFHVCINVFPLFYLFCIYTYYYYYYCCCFYCCCYYYCCWPLYYVVVDDDDDDDDDDQENDGVAYILSCNTMALLHCYSLSAFNLMEINYISSATKKEPRRKVKLMSLFWRYFLSL